MLLYSKRLYLFSSLCGTNSLLSHFQGKKKRLKRCLPYRKRGQNSPQTYRFGSMTNLRRHRIWMQHFHGHFSLASVVGDNFKKKKKALPLVLRETVETKKRKQDFRRTKLSVVFGFPLARVSPINFSYEARCEKRGRPFQTLLHGAGRARSQCVHTWPSPHSALSLLLRAEFTSFALIGRRAGRAGPNWAHS